MARPGRSSAPASNHRGGQRQDAGDPAVRAVGHLSRKRRGCGRQSLVAGALGACDGRLAARAVRAVIVLAAAFAVLVPTAIGMPARKTSMLASPCLIRVVGPVASGTQRLVLHGMVSCSQARRTYRSFLHDESSGVCGSGRICEVLQPGGWQCSYLSAVESKQNHGLKAGCYRRGSSFGAYNVAGTAAQATTGAGITTACSNETVTALEITPVAVTLRFVLHGVSCARAHSLIRAYFRREATPGYCRSRGNICAVQFPGGWTCSLPLYAGEAGGDFVGCTRQVPFATIRVFKVTGPNHHTANTGF